MKSQANLYAVQHGKGNSNNWEDENGTFVAFLLLPGCWKGPY